VTAHLKRAIPKALEGVAETVTKSLGEQFGAKFDEFGKRFDELKPKTPESDKGKPKPDDKPKEQSEETLKLQKQYDELNAKFEAERKARVETELKARDERTYAELRQSLVDAKVRPELVDLLAKTWFHADKRVDFDSEGNPQLRLKVSPGKGLPEEEQTFSISEGVKQFAKSKAAEPFLPAPGGAAGQGNGQRQEQQRQQIDPRFKSAALSDDEADRRAAELLDKLGLGEALSNQ